MEISWIICPWHLLASCWIFCKFDTPNNDILWRVWVSYISWRAQFWRFELGKLFLQFHYFPFLIFCLSCQKTCAMCAEHVADSPAAQCGCRDFEPNFLATAETFQGSATFFFPQVAYDVYLKLNRYPEALRIAMMLNDVELIKSTLDGCEAPYVADVFLLLYINSFASGCRISCYTPVHKHLRLPNHSVFFAATLWGAEYPPPPQQSPTPCWGIPPSWSLGGGGWELGTPRALFF